MSQSDKPIDEFWRWFEGRRGDCARLSGTSDPFWDEILAQLKKIDERLWFEMSRGEDEREFIITVERHTDAFPLLDNIVARAPALSGWKMIALKPAMGFAFVTTYEGIRFDPRTMWFLPLESASRPQDFGMRVGVPNFKEEIERPASNAVEVILDTAIG